MVAAEFLTHHILFCAGGGVTVVINDLYIKSTDSMYRFVENPVHVQSVAPFHPYILIGEPGYEL